MRGGRKGVERRGSGKTGYEGGEERVWREEVAGKQDMRGGRKGVERRGSGKTGYEGGKKGCGEKR